MLPHLQGPTLLGHLSTQGPTAPFLSQAGLPLQWACAVLVLQPLLAAGRPAR